jgi:hypothetical protein
VNGPGYHFTRARDLASVGLIALVLTNLGLRLGYRAIPELPTLGGITLGVLGAAELVLALLLRPRVLRRPETQPLAAQVALRVVVLAKASSLFGSIMLGGWLGLLTYVLPRAGDFPAARHDAAAGAVGAVSAAALVAAALWLEYACRAPRGGEDRHEQRHDERQR